MDDVLFAVFNQDDSLSFINSSHTESVFNSSSNFKNSALCVYTLKAIRRKFMFNIKKCFNGVGQRGLDFISPNMKCVSTKLQTISEDFCGLDVNSPLGGEFPIAVIPLITYNERRLTGAILAEVVNDEQTVIIADSDGKVTKLIFDEKLQQLIAYENIQIVTKNASLNG